MEFQALCSDYLSRLNRSLSQIPVEPLEELAHALMKVWIDGRQVFIFGNGGSAGNAIHLANDLLYGVAKKFGCGIKATALPANSAVLTCLANDEGYDSIFSQQLAVLSEPGDIAIALSGSGNSPNILGALQYCRLNKIHSFAILGYSGGEAKLYADHVIHIPVNDMQISEDLQLVVGHLIMQWLYAHKEQSNLS
jgi:D-sedoheptulose 7-phosphate isomerase